MHEPVSLLDVAPTILALASAPPEPRHQGRSLLAFMRQPDASAVASRPIVSQLEASDDGPDLRVHSAAVLSERRKALLGTTGAIEVYDLAADPREKHPMPPLAVESLDLVAALGATRAVSDEPRGPKAIAQPLDDVTKERLRALGYHY